MYEYLTHLARLDAGDIHPGGARASEALIAALRLTEGSRVLEVGCGTGRTLHRILSRTEVIGCGLDLLSDMLSRARHRLSAAAGSDRVILVKGSAERMPFADATFDAVYCESVLGFQKNRALKTILREVSRVLRPGGTFVANEAIWKADVDDGLAASINSACEMDFGLPQATESAWGVGEWEQAMAGFGLRVQSNARLSEVRIGTGVGMMNPDDASMLQGISATIRKAGRNLSPRLLWQRIQYRSLLRAYRPWSHYVEGRLFVMEREKSVGRDV